MPFKNPTSSLSEKQKIPASAGIFFMESIFKKLL